MRSEHAFAPLSDLPCNFFPQPLRAVPRCRKWAPTNPETRRKKFYHLIRFAESVCTNVEVRLLVKSLLKRTNHYPLRSEYLAQVAERGDAGF